MMRLTLLVLVAVATTATADEDKLIKKYGKIKVIIMEIIRGT